MTREEIIKQLNDDKSKTNGSKPMSELTKREYFSIKILTSLLSDGVGGESSIGMSIDLTDKLLEELSKGG